MMMSAVHLMEKLDADGVWSVHMGSVGGDADTDNNVTC